MSDPSFLDATRVAPAGDAPNRYRADVGDEWNAPTFPCGGVVSAIALRAMEAALDDPSQRLRTFTTMFVSTVDPGALTIDVERLRIGKRMSQLQADVRSAGRDEPGHVTTAAFGETDGVVPALPVPDTLKRVSGGVVEATVDRGGLVAAQTPQAFLAPTLRSAFAGEIAAATACASLLGRVGGRVGIVEGDPALLKVTTPADLAIVERLLSAP